MGKKWGFVVTVCMVCLLAGCGKDAETGTKIESKNAVEEALKEGVEKTNAESVTEKKTEPESTQGAEETGSESAPADASVDIDLTSMGSDMVYATVYQMMNDPQRYVGKTVKMRGSYDSTWYEPTQKYYHFVFIADAAACCAQGMEFIWDDGEHTYPDEYPESGAEVVVTGTFTTYTEPDDPSVYCTVKDATLSIATK